ncbi:jg23712, partial [Pararge aegeria aegeria]
MCDTDNIGVQKKEMDDSGFVFDLSAQDVSMSARVNLMDLSDDVLLYIMRFCAPRDLKALG